MSHDQQSHHEYFRSLLLTVVGQAFAAAGYSLMDTPLQWAGGLFKFSKPLESGLTAYIEFQALLFNDNMWASGTPSRFRVNLVRSDRPIGIQSSHPQFANKTLSQLVVGDFKVAILPSTDHWWSFKDTDSLGKALAEAGHLAIGYGMPWLSGDLQPDQE